MYLRKYSMVFLSVILAALLLTLVSATKPGTIWAADQDSGDGSKRVLNVTGDGIVEVGPDIAYVSMGVVTEDVNSSTAQSKNAQLMNKVVQEIKKLGIAEKDIATVNYNMQPKYSYNRDTGESLIIGYRVTNTVRVTVRDIKKVGSVIDAAVKQGANISNAVTFDISDKGKYYGEALKKAALDAQGKAEVIAEALGLKLKGPVTINENSYGYTPIYRKAVELDEAAAWAADAPTPIEGGTLEIRASLNIVYEY